jgi:hypothetical protein
VRNRFLVHRRLWKKKMRIYAWTMEMMRKKQWYKNRSQIRKTAMKMKDLSPVVVGLCECAGRRPLHPYPNLRVMRVDLCGTGSLARNRAAILNQTPREKRMGRRRSQTPTRMQNQAGVEREVVERAVLRAEDVPVVSIERQHHSGADPTDTLPRMTNWIQKKLQMKQQSWTRTPVVTSGRGSVKPNGRTFHSSPTFAAAVTDQIIASCARSCSSPSKTTMLLSMLESLLSATDVEVARCTAVFSPHSDHLVALVVRRPYSEVLLELARLAERSLTAVTTR